MAAMKDMQALEEVHLRDYIWVLYKRRWALAAFFIVVVSLTIVYSFTAVPLYQGTTNILIEKENPNIMDFKELYAIDTTNQDFYQTQYKLLESRALAGRVIEKLGMKAEGEGVGNPAGGKGVLGSLLFWRRHPSAEEIKESRIDKFLRGLRVEPVRNTRLVKVHYISEEPEFAARAANSVVETYIEQNLEMKIEAIHGASEFLRDKIEEQRKKLEESELLLQQYKEQYNIISLSAKENITVSKLAELNSDVLNAENERVEKETRYRQAKTIENKPDMIESIPNVLDNRFVTSLKQEEANLSKELSELLKKYGDKHPRIITLREKLRATRDNLGTEIRKVVKFLRNEYEVALAKEESLKNALEEQKDESQRLNKLAIMYGVLLRDVETNQQMYDILLTRLKEASISGGIQTTNVRIVDRAIVPSGPVKPNKVLNLLLSLFVGTFGGISLAFFIDYLDNTVKLPGDIEKYLRLPYLGPVPSYSSDLGDTPYENALVALRGPKSTAAESYRGIRTAIVFSSSAERNSKTLLITSTGPAEGKSLTAGNLAVAMAQAGTRTLLVDADFRKPRLHRIFGMARDRGLSNLLVEKRGFEGLIFNTQVPNLDVMPSGPIPPNPAELLGTDAMRQNIEELKGRYDKIIFDSPPVLAVTDAVVLSTLVDEVLLVIAAGELSRVSIRRSIDQLQDVGANVIGGILNNIIVGKDSYYYYQYYYYYYGESDTESPVQQRKSKRKSRQGKKDTPDSA